MSSDADVIIVGAGPAGLSAARELALAGVSVMLIDDNARPGGQYFRHPPPGWGGDAGLLSDSGKRRRDRLLDTLSLPNVTFLPSTTAWHAPSMNTLAITGTRSGRVTAPFLIFATGAHDRVVPFPGWASERVITAGGMLNLIKEQAMVPDGRVVIAGAGPLLLAVAGALSRPGTRVAGVVDESHIRNPLTSTFRMATSSPALLLRGVQYRMQLWHQGTFYTRRAVLNDVRINSDGLVVSIRHDGGGLHQVSCDYLVTGHGLTPSVELLRILGCRFSYRGDRGGWVPERSSDLETSLPGVFAVGDGASIGGAANALAEGALVGRLVTWRLERPGPAGPRATRARLERMRRFQRGLRGFFTFSPGASVQRISDDTLICRCEGITGEAIRERLSAGLDLEQIKACTRATMGRCQGRFCLASLADLAAGAPAYDGQARQARQPRRRPPARLVRISDLSHEPLDPPEPPITLFP